MPSFESDADLILASHDSPSVFAEIFDRHFDPIHAYLARRVGRQLADELASDVFLQAFTARHRYDSDQPNARPWLYGIASRLLSHYYRHEHRRLRAYARAATEEMMPDLTAEVDARVDAAIAAPRIAAALACLEERDRDLLLLFGWGERSYAEIGQALQIPTGTVRSRLNRARRHVRELVGPVGQYRDEDDIAPGEERGTHSG
jgi:RNA polymerase sigma factor (sigma-70 family)